VLEGGSTNLLELPSMMANSESASVACVNGEAIECAEPDPLALMPEASVSESSVPSFLDFLGLAKVFGYHDEEEGQETQSIQSFALVGVSKLEDSESESTTTGSEESMDALSGEADTLLEMHADTEAIQVAESDCSTQLPEAQEETSESSSFWFVNPFSSAQRCSCEDENIKALEYDAATETCIASSSELDHPEDLQVDHTCATTAIQTQMSACEQKSESSTRRDDNSDVLIACLINSTALVSIVCLAIVA